MGFADEMYGSQPSEPVEETAVEEPQEPTPAHEEAPAEPTPEPESPLWQKLGFDDEESFTRKVSNLSDWERDVQRRASQIGQQKAEPPKQEAPADADDPWSSLEGDPATISALRKAVAAEARKLIETEVAPKLSVADEVFQEGARKAFEGFAESKGIDGDELYSVMEQYNLLPQTTSISALKQQMEAAADIIAGRKAKDATAKLESDREAMKAEIRKEIMESLARDGVDITAVVPKKAHVGNDDRDPIEKGSSFSDMLAFVK